MADVEFIEGEGVNVYVRRSKTDQEGTGLVKGLPYGSNAELEAYARKYG